MMTAEQLKASILQMAFEGKLVDQRPEEGTGEELYQQIQTEKQSLIKEGKIKKQKPLPEITEEEKLFEIPESWKWCRIGDSFQVEMGQSPDGNSVSEIGEGIEFHQGKVYFGNKYLLKSPQITNRPTKYAPSNSVLLCVRAPVGKVNITDREICIGRGLCAVTPLAGISVDFVFFLLSTYENVFIKHATGTTFISITAQVVKNQAVPLPPLAEQKRIVAKIEELMPYVEQYDEASKKLDALNTSFPEQLKKSILQRAVEGKLVPQDPSDEPASVLLKKIDEEKQRLIKEGKIKKQKKLPEISEDEIPFDIPDGWRYCRFGSVITLLSGTDFKPENYNAEKRGLPYITGASSLTENGVIENRWTETPANIAERGDVLLVCKGAGYGKTVICNLEKAHIARQIMAIKNTSFLNMDYIRFFLMANIKYIKSRGQGVIPGIDRKSINLMTFPLPPLAEQKRIVDELNELLPLCGKLQS